MKRVQLCLSKLKDDSGNSVQGLDDLQKAAMSFYEKLFSKEDHVSSVSHTAAVDRFLSYILGVLADLDNEALLKPVTLDEVREAV